MGLALATHAGVWIAQRAIHVLRPGFEEVREVEGEVAERDDDVGTKRGLDRPAPSATQSGWCERREAAGECSFGGASPALEQGEEELQVGIAECGIHRHQFAQRQERRAADAWVGRQQQAVVANCTCRVKPMTVYQWGPPHEMYRAQ